MTYSCFMPSFDLADISKAWNRRSDRSDTSRSGAVAIMVRLAFGVRWGGMVRRRGADGDRREVRERLCRDPRSFNIRSERGAQKVNQQS